MEPVLYRRIEDREQAVALIEAAEALLSKELKPIETDADAALLGEFGARVRKHVTDLEKERLEMGAGLRDTLAAINSEFNGPVAKLKEVLGKADAMVRNYLQAKRAAAEQAQREAEQAQREAEEKARKEHEANVAEAEKLGIEAPPPAPVAIADIYVPPPSGVLTGTFGSKVRLKDNWKYRITDIKKVPEQFLVPVEDRVNKSVLNALAKSQKDKASVKGIEFYNEESIGSRVVT